MKIFKLSFRNYFKGLKQVFTPIGIILIFGIIAFTVLISGVSNAIQDMMKGVTATIEGYTFDWGEISGEFYSYFRGLDWSSPEATIIQLTNQDFLIASFQTIIHKLYPNIDIDVQTIATLAQECAVKILGYIIWFVLIFIAGIIVGYFVTRGFIRRDLAHRKWWQAILFSIVDAAILVVAVFLTIKAFETYGQTGIWFVVLILVVMLILSLFEGWLLHGVKRVKLRKVLSIKNIILLLVANVIIIGLGLGTVLLVSLANMIVLTAVLALAIVEVTQVVVTSNAESYVRYLSEDVYYKEQGKKIKKLEKENRELKENADETL